MNNWKGRNPFFRAGKQSNDMTTKPSSELFSNTTAAPGGTDQYRKIQGMPTPPQVQMSDVFQFPRHLYVPEGAESVDISRAFSVSAASSLDILRFVAPQGAKTYFLGYAIFCDALLFSSVDYVPTVNGSRILKYHGDPQSNFKIALGNTVDLGNNAMRSCQLALNPGEILNWRVTNNDVVDIVMAVRMVGYVDSSNTRTNQRFGG
jgi:hypothetical protein